MIIDNKNKQQKGFTLIELLIVIGIIAILAAVVFVVLDPLTRFQDARDATREANIDEILSAIKLYQVDNEGSHIDAINDLNNGQVYLIVEGNKDSGCDDNNSVCNYLDSNEDVSTDGSCVDLSELVDEGYLGEVAISPSSGDVSWDSGEDDNNDGTGYLLEKESSGVIVVRSCEAENTGYKIESSR